MPQSSIFPYMMQFKKGDQVQITAADGDGYTSRLPVDGEVVIASPNGVSLVLQFEAVVAGHPGWMPLLQRDDGSFVTLFGHSVGVVKR